MKLKYLFYPAISFLVLSTSAQGQMNTADSALSILLLSEPVTGCREFAIGACSRITKYYEGGDIDSIRVIISFMNEHCDYNDFNTFDTLLMIRSGDTFEDECDTTALERISRGRYRGLYWPHGAFGYFPQFVQDSPCPDLRDVAHNLADSLLEFANMSPAAQLYLLDYLGKHDEILLTLRNNGYAGLCIQEYYDSSVAFALRSLNDNRLHIGANLGIWTPLRSESVLHTKLELGGQFGMRDGRFGLDLTILLRALNEPREYQVERDGVIENTSSFFGGLIGGDVTLEAVRLGRCRLELFAGLALDGFTAIHDKDNGKSINEFNQSIGFALRVFYNEKRNRFFGIQARHNFVSYDGGGSNLSGNALSLNFVYGAMTSHESIWELERLKYYDKVSSDKIPQR